MVQKQTIPTVQLLMTTGNNVELIRHERNLTINSCVLSREKTIFTMAQNRITELETIKSIFLLTQRFLMANFPDSNIDVTADQFTQDIIELRRDWVLDDILMFFKFIRQRQDIPELKTYGGKITAIKLIEFSNYYENERCEVKETIINDNKYKREESVSVKFLTDFGNELAERMRVDTEKQRADKLERAIKTNQHHKENEQCINWLKYQNATEMEKVTWFNIYRLRK